MFILIVVAGIGWLNSAKAMLVARKEEYQVLRMLGTMVKRVRRICWFQVWSYMYSRIVQKRYDSSRKIRTINSLFGKSIII